MPADGGGAALELVIGRSGSTDVFVADQLRVELALDRVEAIWPPWRAAAPSDAAVSVRAFAIPA